MTFFRTPTLGYKTFKRERLIANDLQIRKVIEHVYEKVMNGGSGEAGSGLALHNWGEVPWRRDGQAGQGGEQQPGRGERVELLCNDTTLDPNMDLRTVKSFIWKSGSDLVLLTTGP